MPQLDFSVFPSQLFWLCICFFTMLFIMTKFIIPRTVEMINLRKAKIDADLEEAAKLKQKVEKTLEKYNLALKKASEEAGASLLKTKEELNQIIERKQADLASELKQQIAEGEKKIIAGKKKAISEIESAVIELAPQILQKLSLPKASAKELQAALKIVKGE